MTDDNKRDAIMDTEAAKEPKEIRVIAPSNLAPGYQFEAESEGKHYMVTVPEGGVKEGQEFTAKASPIPVITASKGVGGSSGPGSWKDGLCSCLRYGCCHPHLCLSFWCMPIALAQVMTRMRLNFLAQRGSVSEVAKTFTRVVVITVTYFLTNWLLGMATFAMMGDLVIDENNSYDVTEGKGLMVMILHYVREILYYAFMIYILIALYRTRKAVREQHNIPTQSCGNYEDVCCTLFCSFCTTMQLMRQTADYDTYNANCCTETGLPSHVDFTNAADNNV